MKIVTVCSQGNNRSVHAAYMLRYRRKVDGGGTNDVIPIGIKTMSRETTMMLFNWADLIILTDKRYLPLLPENYGDKLRIWDVGEDRWPRPFDKELLSLLKAHMERDSAVFK